MSAKIDSVRHDVRSSSALRFLLIDDHPFFLEGLKLGLRSFNGHACQVDSHMCAQDALADPAHLHNYDLILCDLNLPGLDGIAFIEALIELDVFVRVAIISASQYSLDVRRALNAGAAGYINKGANIHEFAQAVDLILKGQRYTPEKKSLLSVPDKKSSLSHLASREEKSEQKNIVLNDPLQLNQRLEQIGISPRQYEVLQLVAQGLSNQAISQQLSIQESTVKSHLKVLFQVLGVNNRTASIVAARALKLLADPE